MEMSRDRIITAAREVHQKLWRATSDEGGGDRMASAVTKAWQEAVVGKEVAAEVTVAEELNERLDVVDRRSRTAYELKVSGKNPQHEFYKDIFKVFIYNQHHQETLARFVFVTEESGAAVLRRSMAGTVQDYCEPLGFQIEIVGI